MIKVSDNEAGFCAGTLCEPKAQSQEFFLPLALYDVILIWSCYLRCTAPTTFCLNLLFMAASQSGGVVLNREELKQLVSHRRGPQGSCKAALS